MAAVRRSPFVLVQSYIARFGEDDRLENARGVDSDAPALVCYSAGLLRDAPILGESGKGISSNPEFTYDKIKANLMNALHDKVEKEKSYALYIATLDGVLRKVTSQAELQAMMMLFDFEWNQRGFMDEGAPVKLELFFIEVMNERASESQMPDRPKKRAKISPSGKSSSSGGGSSSGGVSMLASTPTRGAGTGGVTLTVSTNLKDVDQAIAKGTKSVPVAATAAVYIAQRVDKLMASIDLNRFDVRAVFSQRDSRGRIEPIIRPAMESSGGFIPRVRLYCEVENMFDPSRRVVCGFSWNSGHELYKNGTCSGIFRAAPELMFKGIGDWNETLRGWGYYSENEAGASDGISGAAAAPVAAAAVAAGTATEVPPPPGARVRRRCDQTVRAPPLRSGTAAMTVLALSIATKTAVNECPDDKLTKGTVRGAVENALSLPHEFLKHDLLWEPRFQTALDAALQDAGDSDGEDEMEPLWLVSVAGTVAKGPLQNILTFLSEKDTDPLKHSCKRSAFIAVMEETTDPIKLSAWIDSIDRSGYIAEKVICDGGLGLQCTFIDPISKKGCTHALMTIKLDGKKEIKRRVKGKPVVLGPFNTTFTNANIQNTGYDKHRRMHEKTVDAGARSILSMWGGLAVAQAAATSAEGPAAGALAAKRAKEKGRRRKSRSHAAASKSTPLATPTPRAKQSRATPTPTPRAKPSAAKPSAAKPSAPVVKQLVASDAQQTAPELHSSCKDYDPGPHLSCTFEKGCIFAKGFLHLKSILMQMCVARTRVCVCHSFVIVSSTPPYLSPHTTPLYTSPPGTSTTRRSTT